MKSGDDKLVWYQDRIWQTLESVSRAGYTTLVSLRDPGVTLRADQTELQDVGVEMHDKVLELLAVLG